MLVPFPKSNNFKYNESYILSWLYAIKIIDEESNEEKIEVFPTKEETLDYIFKYNKQ